MLNPTIRFTCRVVTAVLITSATICLGACGPQTAMRTETPPAPAAGTRFVLGHYTGVLPCADCRGINTKLILLAKSQFDTGGGTFELSEEYVGTRDGNRTVETRGRWILLRGTPTDVDATVYQLNAADSERVVFYRRLPDQALRLLDREQRDIQSSADYTLARVGESPVGGYRAIDPTNETRRAAEYAVSEQASRAGESVVLRRILRAERQVVQGVNYRLCLEVEASGQAQEVHAIVFQNLQQRMSLTEWTTQRCAE